MNLLSLTLLATEIIPTHLVGNVERGLIAIGAGIAVATGIGAGIGQGMAAGRASAAIGRNPQAEGKIRSTMILGIALAETSALYGLVVSILLLFVF